jgi:hypothetical protein
LLPAKERSLSMAFVWYLLDNIIRRFLLSWSSSRG